MALTPRHLTPIHNDNPRPNHERALAIDTMARTIWGEARGEPLRGKEAVACVILNRLAASRARAGGMWWGNTIVQICRKPYQFSCWNANDPNYRKLLKVDARDRAFATCLRISRRAVAGLLQDVTNGATHYHTSAVSPSWSRGQDTVAQIGSHLFYTLEA